MRVEVEYEDILQNIEFVIVANCRTYPDLTDYGVMNALEALIDAYTGEKIGRPPRNFRLSDLERSLMEDMRGMCEWRLGRGESSVKMPDGTVPSPEPITVDQIILCLQRLLKSTKKWNKQGGMRGYLDFIDQFII